MPYSLNLAITVITVKVGGECMVSNAFDKSMDITATISLLLRQRLQSSVSLINDVSQLQLYVDAYTVYAEMKSNNMLL